MPPLYPLPPSPCLSYTTPQSVLIQPAAVASCTRQNLRSGTQQQRAEGWVVSKNLLKEHDPPTAHDCFLARIVVFFCRTRQGKKRIGKAAKQWRRAAKLAGAENPDEMLAAYLESGHPRAGPGSLLKRILSRVRIRPNWKVRSTAAYRAVLVR